MGEAKARGSKEDRSRTAEQDREADVAGAREAMGIPDDAPFCGYVVHVPEMDDYLAEIYPHALHTNRSYRPSPEYAMRFPHRWRAVEAARSVPKPAVVGLLFDVGRQYRVVFEIDDLPGEETCEGE